MKKISKTMRLIKRVLENKPLVGLIRFKSGIRPLTTTGVFKKKEQASETDYFNKDERIKLEKLRNEILKSEETALERIFSRFAPAMELSRDLRTALLSWKRH